MRITDHTYDKIVDYATTDNLSESILTLLDVVYDLKSEIRSLKHKIENMNKDE